MPFARLTVADPQLSVETQHELAEGITKLLSGALLKEPEVTVVNTVLVPREQWFVAAIPRCAATGAHLEVSITAGTNTAEEKAAFLSEAYRLLVEALHTLPPAVYVALHELDAESYGYNGISQLARRRQDPAEKD
jgi:4-oxalocrotonate tautomerase